MNFLLFVVCFSPVILGLTVFDRVWFQIIPESASAFVIVSLLVVMAFGLVVAIVHAWTRQNPFVIKLLITFVLLAS